MFAQVVGNITDIGVGIPITFSPRVLPQAGSDKTVSKLILSFKNIYAWIVCFQFLKAQPSVKQLQTSEWYDLVM